MGPVKEIKTKQKMGHLYLHLHNIKFVTCHLTPQDTMIK